MEWISVKDQLPELDVEVLATSGDTTKVATMQPSYIDEDGTERSYWTYYDYLEWHDVSHWMPLPDSPYMEK